jgi:hypothetical protein
MIINHNYIQILILIDVEIHLIKFILVLPEQHPHIKTVRTMLNHEHFLSCFIKL